MAGEELPFCKEKPEHGAQTPRCLVAREPSAKIWASGPLDCLRTGVGASLAKAWRLLRSRSIPNHSRDRADRHRNAGSSRCGSRELPVASQLGENSIRAALALNRSS